MVQLNRVRSTSLFAVGGDVSAPFGVAFFPDAPNPAGDTLTVDDAAVQAGFFAIWSGNAPSDAGLASIETRLDQARDAATVLRRDTLHFFSAPDFSEPAVIATSEGDSNFFLKDATLELRTTNGEILKGAHSVSIGRSRIAAEGTALVLKPIPGAQHQLRFGDSDRLPVALFSIPLSGPHAGAVICDTAAPPPRVSRNGFSNTFTQRGDLVVDDDGGKFYSINRVERPPIVSGDATGRSELCFSARFDILDATNPDRTCFEPRATKGPLLSGFAGTNGHIWTLTPRPAEADAGGMRRGTMPRFVYVRRRTSETIDEIPRYERAFLALEGDFDGGLAHPVETASDATSEDAIAEFPLGPHGLVVGEGAHEFLIVGRRPHADTAAKTRPVVMFRRGGGYIAPSTDTTISTSAPTLEARDATTDAASWIAVTEAPEDAVTVAAAPAVSEPRDLRRIEGGSDAAAADTPLRLLPDPVLLTPRDEAGPSPDFTPGPNRFLPAVPQDVLGKRDGRRIDSVAERLAVIRRERLIAQRPRDTLQGDTLATEPVRKRTPNGFEIEEQDGRIVAVVLGRSRSVDGPVSGSISLRGRGVDGKPQPLASPFVDALIRNELFIVLNDHPAPTIASGESAVLQADLEISGWNFRFDFGEQWARYEAEQQKPKPEDRLKIQLPFTLIKVYEGKSISELIEEPGLWTWSQRLRAKASGVDPVANAKAQIKTMIDRAKTPGSDGKLDHLFATFRRAVDDPSWTGVLLLEMPIGLANLPEQVSGLASGMDTSRLFAHHLGIPIRRLGKAEDEPNMLFAAIEYASTASEKPQYDEKLVAEPFSGGREPAANGADDAFAIRVESLRVGFSNGALQSFECDLRLKIGNFFHDTDINVFEVDKTQGELAVQEIALKGRFTRRREGADTYESYDFFSDTIFKLKTNRLPLVSGATLRRIGYVTTVSQVDNVRSVASRFDIDGDLTFKAVNSVDFIDLDSLAFRNLGIDLSFKVPDTGRVGRPKFRFSPGGLLLDFDTAKLKEGALGILGSFPLKFSGLGWLEDGVTLPQLGFFQLGGIGTAGRGASRFVLNFDLDLGALGHLASTLEALKMKLAIGFGIDSGNSGVWDFGFTFEGSGGRGLDIGLQGILKLTCEAYELREFNKDGQTFWGFVGVNAKLIVLGEELPPEGTTANLFLFVDPGNLRGAQDVGWFLGASGGEFGVVELDVLALGQRVDPLPGLGAVASTRDALASLKDLSANDPEKIIELFNENKIVFDKNRGWSIAFKGTIYKLVELGFVMRDPDLAGILFDLKLQEGSDETLFSIDILYRKLTDELGVYATLITPPPALRHIEMGAVSITLPSIGLEIFTDGGFTIDLGFPAGKDFSRSFALSILPFTGAGGFYFRRVSGPAARFLPRQLRYDAPGGQILEAEPIDLRYDPITEAEVAFRVGIGKDYNSGPLRAGLSLTVYAFLGGGFGTLFSSDPLTFRTGAARRYIVVAGAVGVMGEVYGYVDFGIVRAGVSIQLWVEVGFRLETDRATRLHYEVGVRVRIVIVVARIKIFGKRIEIKASFAFDTTLRFTTMFGRSNDTYYIRSDQSAFSDAAQIAGDVDWTRIPQPADWLPNGEKLAIELILQPDVTLAESQGEFHAHAVMMLAAVLPRVNENVSPIERLVQGMTLWALKAGFGGADATTAEELTAFAESLAGDGLAAVKARRTRLPGFAQLTRFLATNFAATLRRPEDDPASGDSAPDAAPMPFPPGLTLKITRGGTAEAEPYDPSAFTFVDDDYRDELDAAFRRFQLAQGEDDEDVALDMLGDGPISLCEALFEEWAGMLIRSGVAWLAHRADELAPEGSVRLQPLLDALVVRGESDRLRSPAAEIAAVTGRFMLYGHRAPQPGSPVGPLPPQLPAPDRADDATTRPDVRFHQPLFLLAGLQLPLSGIAALAPVGGDVGGWLTVPPDHATDVDATLVEAYVAAAADATIKAVLEDGPLYVERPRYVAVASYEQASRLADADVSPAPRLWRFGAEALEVLDGGRGAGDPPGLFLADPMDAAKRSFEKVAGALSSDLAPAIVVDVEIRQLDPIAPNAFEIGALPEALRVLLDPFAEGAAGDADRPGLTGLRLYKRDTEGASLLPIGGDTGLATLIQTNLSVEPKPLDAADVLDAQADDDPVPAMAQNDRPLDFLRLLRRAATVNTGGYYIAYPGASEELDELFERGDEPTFEEGTRIAQVHVVATLDPTHARALFYANALRSAFGAAEEPSETSILAFGAGPTREPLHEPGVLPIKVRRPIAPDIDDTADALGKEMAEELAARFSMLAVEVVVRNAAGAEIGRQHADQAIAFGPDLPETGPTFDDLAEDDDLVYRAPIPVTRIAGVSNPYGLVGGGTISLRGLWRDIYGNAWKDDAFSEIKRTMRYSDRLVGLGDVPFISVAFWPDEKTRRLKLGAVATFDALLSLDGRTGETSAPDDAWLASRRTELRRAAASVTRAADQLDDANVTLTFVCSLATPEDAPDEAGVGVEKLAFVKVLRRAAEVLGDLSAAHPDGTTRSGIKRMIRQAVEPNAAALQHIEDIDLPPVRTNVFVEFEAMLRTARDSPTERPDLYPEHEETPTEVFIAENRIAPNLERPGTGAEKGMTPFALGSGDMAEFLWALAAVTPDHLIAIGHGSTPGLTEKAIWLVARDPVDTKLGGEVYAETPISLAIPPLATAARSYVFGEENPLEVFVGGPTAEAQTRNFRDVDADHYGRLALSLIERLLEPRIAAGFAGTAVDRAELRAALDGLLAAKEGLANEFAVRASVVLQDQTAAYDGLTSERREEVVNRLADRFKRDLRTVYTLESALLYPDPDTASQLDAHPVAHGVVHRVGPEAVTLSAYNLPFAGRGEATARDLLVLCEVNPKFDGAHQASYALPNRFEITHLQRLARPSRADRRDRYRPTAWLRLVSDTAALAITLPTDGFIPAPDRGLPPKPIIDAEGYTVGALDDTESLSKRIDATRAWTSWREIVWTSENENDRLKTVVIYGARELEGDAADVIDEPLDMRLVRFVLETDIVLEAAGRGNFDAFKYAGARARSLFDRAPSDVAATSDTLEAPSAGRDEATFSEPANPPFGVPHVRAEDVSLTQADLIAYAHPNAFLGLADREPAEVTSNGEQPFGDGPGAGGGKRRRIEMRGLDIIRHANAETELTQTRNTHIKGRPLQELFIYRLPIIASGEKVSPVLDRLVEIHVGAFDPDDEASARTAIAALLQALLAVDAEASPPTPAPGYVLDVVVEYESGLFATPAPRDAGPDGAAPDGLLDRGGPIISIRVEIDGTRLENAANAIAEDVSRWFRTEKPGRRGGLPIGAVIVDARLFVSQGPEAGRRILRLRRCRFDFNKRGEM
ncbi:hypothetical protein RDV64_08970 [Acuticoccus sp. MNP-M23]|uniref:hypothetical protein n=1 Tax=Acuticoccus sp. MNP-M23 TaxID=3072793 RepID=UPI00281596D7|nr:hypothetical protein [Acuticoccus sp. MNP-M23]WMS44502.1 hypothetical protein RDV64_08970 [Acuticoccus sp. MNP-M23]